MVEEYVELRCDAAWDWAELLFAHVVGRGNMVVQEAIGLIGPAGWLCRR